LLRQQKKKKREIGSQCKDGMLSLLLEVCSLRVYGDRVKDVVIGCGCTATPNTFRRFLRVSVRNKG
jgi:hypothetical protein